MKQKQLKEIQNLEKRHSVDITAFHQKTTKEKRDLELRQLQDRRRIEQEVQYGHLVTKLSNEKEKAKVKFR